MKYYLYVILFTLILCFTLVGSSIAQIEQYQSYRVITETSFSEPDTTIQKTDIILDLNRDRISLIEPDDTMIYNILLEMEDKDNHGNYIRTFQVEGRNSNEEYRFHFIRQEEQGEPVLIIFEWREFGGVNAFYHLK